MNISGKLSGYRTYLVALAGIITAWLTCLGGDMSTKEAVQASFAALSVIFLRKGISTEVGNLFRNYQPLLAVLLLPLLMTSCSLTDALTDTGTAPKKALSFDFIQGVCYTTPDGKSRGCYNPLTNVVTVVRTGVSGSTSLTYDATTKVWRGTAPDGSALVWDQVHGLRTEPALPTPSK